MTPEKCNDIQESIADLKTQVMLGQQNQTVIARDLTSLTTVVREHMITGDRVEKEIRESLIRIELKLARWTGMAAAGYMVLGVVWAIMEVFIK